MAKIKYTKNELKGQKDDLARFRRFLPTLILKKQQLQMEIHRLDSQKKEKESSLESARSSIMKWVDVFGEDVGVEGLLKIKAVNTDTGNIAGVDIPIFKGVDFEEPEYDLFDLPLWVDAAIEELKKILAFMAEARTLEEAAGLLGEELRITTQRVNLFEKVKIPDALENIRIIKIFLGDQDTAAVVRGKIAKGKLTRAA